MEYFFHGLGVGAGLIIAIGAQNSFVLSQGIKRQYRLMVATVCSLADILLIFAGAAGIGAIIASNGSIRNVAAWGGAIFLFWYGGKSLASAVRGNTLESDGRETPSRYFVLSTTLALTFLNPHVYVDTVVLIGSVSGQYETEGRYMFAAGASLSSCLWFFTLAYGASLLSPLFRKTAAWRLLDTIVWLIMWTIAFRLLYMIQAF